MNQIIEMLRTEIFCLLAMMWVAYFNKFGDANSNSKVSATAVSPEGSISKLRAGLQTSYASSPGNHFAKEILTSFGNKFHLL